MLRLHNEIHSYHITSACDIIKETIDYYHINVHALALKAKINPSKLTKTLKRKLYLSDDELQRIGKQLHLSAQLLINLDKSYRVHH